MLVQSTIYELHKDGDTGSERMESRDLIRCKDCKHYDGLECHRTYLILKEDDFCSRAEKKEEKKVGETVEMLNEIIKTCREIDGMIEVRKNIRGHLSNSDLMAQEISDFFKAFAQKELDKEND